MTLQSPNCRMKREGILMLVVVRNSFTRSSTASTLATKPALSNFYPRSLSRVKDTYLVIFKVLDHEVGAVTFNDFQIPYAIPNLNCERQTGDLYRSLATRGKKGPKTTEKVRSIGQIRSVTDIYYQQVPMIVIRDMDRYHEDLHARVFPSIEGLPDLANQFIGQSPIPICLLVCYTNHIGLSGFDGRNCESGLYGGLRSRSHLISSSFFDGVHGNDLSLMV
ncbi:hypothetical protein GGS21DRAFT_213723 [Xylaria nigripes]|nr:hypothetical protein GGS21DRAFT_213723 [Xylaria nigripes]